MNASDLPSGDGVGRIEPPEPVTNGSGSPGCPSGCRGGAARVSGGGRAGGGRGGADGAAGAGDERLGLAELPVEALDDVDLPVRIFVVLERAARCRVVAVIEVAAVGREDRLAGVLLVVALLGELQAVAAAAVVEPHLARAERALRGEVL